MSFNGDSNVEYEMVVEKVEKKNFYARTPFLTYFFMIAQILVFLWLELQGGSTNTSTLIKYGAKVNSLIYQGEWWRFVTPIFLHIGFMHLASNTLALYFLGTSVEKMYGSTRFFFIYIFAGILGSISSFIFSPNLSAGASGAIFGCLGALLFFGAKYPKLFFRTIGSSVLIILIINLAIDFNATGIDNAGHIGGLIGGFIAAGIVHLPKDKRPFLQFLFLLAATAIILVTIMYGFSPSVKAKDESTNIMLAQDLIKNHDYNKAYSLLKNVEEKSKKPSPQLYFLLSYTEIKKDLLPNAKEHLLQALKLEPAFHEADYNLALIYMEENNLQQAKKYAEDASRVEPNHKEYSNLVNEINILIQSAGE